MAWGLVGRSERIGPTCVSVGWAAALDVLNGGEWSAVETDGGAVTVTCTEGVIWHY